MPSLLRALAALAARLGPIIDASAACRPPFRGHSRGPRVRGLVIQFARLFRRPFLEGVPATSAMIQPASTIAHAPPVSRRNIWALARDYVALTKPKIILPAGPHRDRRDVPRGGGFAAPLDGALGAVWGRSRRRRGQCAEPVLGPGHRRADGADEHAAPSRPADRPAQRALLRRGAQRHRLRHPELVGEPARGVAHAGGDGVLRPRLQPIG